MTAVSRKRSLSTYLRGLFQRRATQRGRLKSTLITPDYDEAPQRHMLEAQRQMSRATPRSVHKQHHHNTQGRHSSGTRQNSKAVSNRKHAGPVWGSQPATRATATAAAAPSDQVCVADAATVLTSLHPPVAPLEMFYHSFVAPYDTRMPRKATEGEAGAHGKSADRKGALKLGKQLCAKKSSKDNTIGSIDSIHSEEALAVERKHHADDEDVVLLTSVQMETKKRQFEADSVKRSGLRVDGSQSADPDETHGENRPSCKVQNQRPTPGQSRRLGNSADIRGDKSVNGKDAEVKPAIEIFHMGETIVAEDFIRDGSCPGLDDDAVEDARASLMSLPPSDASTLAANIRDDDNVEGILSPEDEDTSDADIMSSQIDNTMITMKRTHDRVKVSGKYSQVIVTHGHNRDMTATASDISAGPSSTVAPTEHRDQQRALDLTARLGGHTSFNICGENVYITVGSKKTKVKACRKKKTVRAHSAGVNEAVGNAGTSKNDSGGPPAKKTKLKKKLKKKKVKTSKAREHVEGDTCVKREADVLHDRPCSSATYTKIANSNLVGDLNGDHKTSTICETIARFTNERTNVSATPQDVDQEFVDGETDGPSLKGQPNVMRCVRRLTIPSTPGAVRGGYHPLHVKDGVTYCYELSAVEERPSASKLCSSKGKERSKDVKGEVDESIDGCLGGAYCASDETEEGWVLVTMNTLGQRPEPEGQDMGESDSALVRVGSSSSPEAKNYIAVPLQICRDKVRGHPEDGTVAGENQITREVPTAQGKYTTREIPTAQGNDTSREIPTTQGKDTTREIPTAQGKDTTREIPTAQGKDATREIPTAQGEDATKEIPTAQGKDATREIPTAQGKDATREMPTAQGKYAAYIDKNISNTTKTEGAAEGLVKGASSPASEISEVDEVSTATSCGTLNLNNPSNTCVTQGLPSPSAAADDQSYTTAVIGGGCGAAAAAAKDDAAVDNDGADELSSGVVDESGFVDVYTLQKAWHVENRTLKKQITKYRERSRHVTRLQQLIGQLERETAEMKRMLEGLDGQTAALRNEAADMRCTLSAVCDSSVADLSRNTEARSLEPACFRRYTNVRTPLDAANLLSAVRSRIKALGELEILVYRKQLVLHHVLPSSTQDRLPGPKRVMRAIHKGPKPKKTDESTAKKGSIVIEVVSPSIESGVTTPSWSEEVTNTESPMTTSAPFSESVEGETTPPICQVVDTSNI